MKIKIDITDKERYVLYRILWFVLGITLMFTGIYAIGFLELIGIIKSGIHIFLSFLVFLVQWFVVMRAVVKHYR